MGQGIYEAQRKNQQQKAGDAMAPQAAILLIMSDSPQPKRVSHKVIGLAVLYAFGPVFLMSTNPSHLPLALIVVPFLWLFAALFATAWLMLGLIGPFKPRKRRFLVAGAGSSLPVMLLVFRSIHQLTLRDVLLTAALIAVATFYVSRADFIH